MSTESQDSKREKPRITITLDKEILRTIDDYVEKLGENRSKVLAKCVVLGMLKFEELYIKTGRPLTKRSGEVIDVAPVEDKKEGDSSGDKVAERYMDKLVKDYNNPANQLGFTQVY